MNRWIRLDRVAREHWIAIDRVGGSTSDLIVEHPEALVFGNSNKGMAEINARRERLRLRRAFQEGYYVAPTTKPVPYTGIQFLDIPEFQDLGTNVSQQMSAAIAGQKPVAAALSQSQLYAQDVGDSYK